MNNDQLGADESAHEILLEAYMQVHDEQEKLGHLPDSRKSFLSRHSVFLQMTGAIHLGLFIASLTILLNYIVLRMILHIE